MEQEKNKNRNKLVPVVIFLLLVILILSGYIVYDKVLGKKVTIDDKNKPTAIENIDKDIENTKNNSENTEKVENNDKQTESNEQNTTTNTTETVNNVIESKTIELSKEQYQDHDFYDLRLHFRGSTIDNSSNYYYNLDLYLNEKMLNTHFFNDYYLKIRKSIFVMKIDDVYLISAFVPRQEYNNDVLIINKEGTILKAFEFVKCSIDNGIITIDDPNMPYNTHLNNMHPEEIKKSAEMTKTYTYTVSGATLIEH